MRTAIYARYSSDLQSDASIDDQVALCRNSAQRDGLVVTNVYFDRAMSGSTIHGRVGFQSMVADILRGQFDCVLVESLDRVSRDQEDLASFYKRMSFLGVEVREVNGGKATALNVSVRALVGSIYLTDLAAKTHRGLSGRIRAGKSAGGKCYGYRPVLGQPGELEIVPEEAEIVREIFKAYMDGESPRLIAGRLNARGVRPPRGIRWNASTINGSHNRANGILGNSIYVGDLIWNRVKMIRNPDNGKRVSRANPPALWQTTKRPDLAIVSQEEWDAVRAARRRRQAVAPSRARTPTHPLSGLLRCHCCGGGMSIKDRYGDVIRVHCSTRRESGSCTNNQTFKLNRIEAAVFSGLQANLNDEEAMKLYLETYTVERRRLLSERISNRDASVAKLAKVSLELERAMDALLGGVISHETIGPRIKALENEKAILMREIENSASVPVLQLSNAARAKYRDAAAFLATAMIRLPTDLLLSVTKTMRELIADVTVYANYQIDVRARVEALVNPGADFGVFSGSGGTLQLKTPTEDPTVVFRMAA